MTVHQIAPLYRHSEDCDTMLYGRIVEELLDLPLVRIGQLQEYFKAHRASGIHKCDCAKRELGRVEADLVKARKAQKNTKESEHLVKLAREINHLLNLRSALKREVENG